MYKQVCAMATLNRDWSISLRSYLEVEMGKKRGALVYSRPSLTVYLQQSEVCFNKRIRLEHNPHPVNFVCTVNLVCGSKIYYSQTFFFFSFIPSPMFHDCCKFQELYPKLQPLMETQLGGRTSSYLSVAILVHHVGKCATLKVVKQTCLSCPTLY